MHAHIFMYTYLSLNTGIFELIDIVNHFYYISLNIYLYINFIAPLLHGVGSRPIFFSFLVRGIIKYIGPRLLNAEQHRIIVQINH